MIHHSAKKKKKKKLWPTKQRANFNAYTSRKTFMGTDDRLAVAYERAHMLFTLFLLTRDFGDTVQVIKMDSLGILLRLLSTWTSTKQTESDHFDVAFVLCHH